MGKRQQEHCWALSHCHWELKVHHQLSPKCPFLACCRALHKGFPGTKPIPPPPVKSLEEDNRGRSFYHMIFVESKLTIFLSLSPSDEPKLCRPNMESIRFKLIHLHMGSKLMTFMSTSPFSPSCPPSLFYFPCHCHS